ncbi:MAG: TetR/AcrR family transcriptional regulator [Sphingobium sp.]
MDRVQALETSSVVGAEKGRPRDQAIDDRVLDVAIGLYAREGWAGFRFEPIARESGVGKGALYRRWPDRAALLAATLDARWQGLHEIDTGTLRGDLVQLARFMLRLMMGDRAGVALNMQIDSRRFEEVRAVATPFQARTVDRIRQIMGRAIDRGELDPATDIRLLTDMLVGPVYNHVLATPDHLRATMTDRADSFCRALVDILLGGLPKAPSA